MNIYIRNVLLGIVVVAIAVGAFLYFRPDSSRGEASTRAVVAAFGEQLQNVSLLAPDASSTMATAYGPYVTPELLASWQKHPADAPGRQTSSPWPDHIQITGTAQQGAGYVVRGGVVLLTSSGLAGVIPIVVQVIPQNGTWLIAAYQEQATTTSSR